LFSFADAASDASGALDVFGAVELRRDVADNATPAAAEPVFPLDDSIDPTNPQWVDEVVLEGRVFEAICVLVRCCIIILFFYFIFRGEAFALFLNFVFNYIHIFPIP
jgi:hypothetical protein